VFRLTEDEYTQMKKACSRVHRSMSDYTRVVLLSSMKDKEKHADLLKGGLRRVGQQLANLQTSLQDIREILLCDNTTARTSRKPSAETQDLRQGDTS
jgi:hypothetical protein